MIRNFRRFQFDSCTEFNNFLGENFDRQTSERHSNWNRRLDIDLMLFAPRVLFPPFPFPLHMSARYQVQNEIEQDL